MTERFAANLLRSENTINLPIPSLVVRKFLAPPADDGSDPGRLRRWEHRRHRVVPRLPLRDQKGRLRDRLPGYQKLPGFRHRHGGPSFRPAVGLLLQEPLAAVPAGQAEVRGRPGGSRQQRRHDPHHRPTDSLFQIRLGTARGRPAGCALRHVRRREGDPVQPHRGGRSGDLPDRFHHGRISVEQEHRPRWARRAPDHVETGRSKSVAVEAVRWNGMVFKFGWLSMSITE